MLFGILLLFREALGIPLLQKIGYFVSYQSFPFQFTLIASDQTKQRNYICGHALHLDCFFHFICFNESSLHIVSIVSIVFMFFFIPFV